ncbi:MULTISPECIES: hypothetical protein [unclassified Bacillus (in: firmicutes)]|nr:MULTISPECIES: hypothetical protein [unclassified Bacillus (in: firmicutes)]
MKRETDNGNFGVHVIRLIVFSMVLSIVGLVLCIRYKNHLD